MIAVIALVQPEQVFVVAAQLVPGAQGDLAVDDGLQDGDLAHAVQAIVDAHRLQCVLQYGNRLAVVPGLLVEHAQAGTGLDEPGCMGSCASLQFGNAGFVACDGPGQGGVGRGLCSGLVLLRRRRGAERVCTGCVVTQSRWRGQSRVGGI